MSLEVKFSFNSMNMYYYFHATLWTIGKFIYVKSNDLKVYLQQFQQQKISFAGLKLQHPSIRSLSHKAEKLA